MMRWPFLLLAIAIVLMVSLPLCSPGEAQIVLRTVSQGNMLTIEMTAADTVGALQFRLVGVPAVEKITLEVGAAGAILATNPPIFPATILGGKLGIVLLAINGMMPTTGPLLTITLPAQAGTVKLDPAFNNVAYNITGDIPFFVSLASGRRITPHEADAVFAVMQRDVALKAAYETRKGPPEWSKAYGLTQKTEKQDNKGRIIRIEYTRGKWRRVETYNYKDGLKLLGKEYVRKRSVKIWREP